MAKTAEFYFMITSFFKNRKGNEDMKQNSAVLAIERGGGAYYLFDPSTTGGNTSDPINKQVAACATSLKL